MQNTLHIPSILVCSIALDLPAAEITSILDLTVQQIALTMIPLWELTGGSDSKGGGVRGSLLHAVASLVVDEPPVVQEGVDALQAPHIPGQPRAHLCKAQTPAHILPVLVQHVVPRLLIHLQAHMHRVLSSKTHRS